MTWLSQLVKGYPVQMESGKPTVRINSEAWGSPFFADKEKTLIRHVVFHVPNGLELPMHHHPVSETIQLLRGGLSLCWFDRQSQQNECLELEPGHSIVSVAPYCNHWGTYERNSLVVVAHPGIPMKAIWT